MRIAARRMSALLLATLVIPALSLPSAFAAGLPPDAVDDTPPLIAEDGGATAINVLGNDTDPTNDTLTIVSVTQGTIGTVVITDSGAGLTYEPAANANGTDTFTYTISDGTGQDTATVNITIDPWNDAPSFTILGDQTVAEDPGTVTVPAFAVGSPGPANESTQPLTYIIDGNTLPALFATRPPSTARPATSPTRPPPTRAARPRSRSTSWTPVRTATVTSTSARPSPSRSRSRPSTTPPVAAADGTYQVRQNSVKTVSAGAGVLANDTDAEHSPLTAVLDTDVSNGTLTLHADGSFVYTPTNGFAGTDSFTYHANDGSVDGNIATVTFHVYVNSQPVAVTDTATVVSGSGYVAIGVLTNDNAANPDVGETLTITEASDPAHGTVTVTGGGTGLSYRPDAGYIGADHFTYKISDGLLTASATVTVNVPKDTYKPVATAPVQTITSQTLGTSTVAVRIGWTGTDKGAGVASYELWQSVNGHTYTKLKTTTGTFALVSTTVGSSYQFRVRAIDKKANIGAFAYGPKFSVLRYQETSASYIGSWPTSNSTLLQRRPCPRHHEPRRQRVVHDQRPDVHLGRRQGQHPRHGRRVRRRRAQDARHHDRDGDGLPPGRLLDHLRGERHAHPPDRLHRGEQQAHRRRRVHRPALTERRRPAGPAIAVSPVQ